MVKSMNWPMSLINKILTVRSLSGCFNSTFTTEFWVMEQLKKLGKDLGYPPFLWPRMYLSSTFSRYLRCPKDSVATLYVKEQVEGKSVFKFKKYIFLSIYIKFWDWSVLWISNEIHIRLRSTIKDFFISFAIF